MLDCKHYVDNDGSLPQHNCATSTSESEVTSEPTSSDDVQTTEQVSVYEAERKQFSHHYGYGRGTHHHSQDSEYSDGEHHHHHKVHHLTTSQKFGIRFKHLLIVMLFPVVASALFMELIAEEIFTFEEAEENLAPGIVLLMLACVYYIIVYFSTKSMQHSLHRSQRSNFHIVLTTLVAVIPPLICAFCIDDASRTIIMWTYCLPINGVIFQYTYDHLRLILGVILFYAPVTLIMIYERKITNYFK